MERLAVLDYDEGSHIELSNGAIYGFDTWDKLESQIKAGGIKPGRIVLIDEKFETIEPAIPDLKKNSITHDSIHLDIKAVEFRHFKVLGKRFTHCYIEMKSGYVATAYEVCVDDNNYNESLGERYSFEKAFSTLWPLEGYRLQNELNKA